MDTDTPRQVEIIPLPPEVVKRERRHWLRNVLALLVAAGAGAAITAAAMASPTVARSGIDGLAPTPTVTRTQVITQAPAPPPPGTSIGSWSGSGNEATPAFNAPASGDYVVSWTFSGNTDPELGDPVNFIISCTDQSADCFGTANVIAASGSGSTEVTGASGVESFNVQADGSWTINVVTAS